MSASGAYLVTALAPVNVPQTEPIPGREFQMIVNNAGGYVFQASDVSSLDRFLLLGTEGGTYYASERKLTLEAANHVKTMIANGQGKAIVDRVVEFSKSGRAPRQNPLVFTLALVSRLATDRDTRAYAYKHVKEVCTIPTTLFTFIEFQKAMATKASWGAGMRRAVSEWYLSRSADQLAYQTTKYKSRMNWNHRDVLRLAHVFPNSSATRLVLRFLARGFEEVRKVVEWASSDANSYDESSRKVAKFLSVLHQLETCTSEEEVAKLVRLHRLAWEHVPSRFHRSKAVWKELLTAGMPITALVRNLGRMASIGILGPLSEETAMVCAALRDRARLKASKIHPFSIMLALKTYGAGKGSKGSLKWDPNQQVMDALDEAYYLAFENVEPTGKRYLIGIDVSGSMSSPIHGTDVSSRDAACAIASALVRTETNVHTMAFQDKFVPFQIGKKESLKSIICRSQCLPFGSTDCSLPMEHALKNRIPVDVFVVLTDNETYFGHTHPSVALKNYRTQMGIPDAKLAVIAFAVNEFSIADPEDVNMMDFVGLDASIPAVLADFARN